MNIDDERFCELAQKAIAKKAAPAEQAELEALLAGDPKLKEEFEEMGVDAALAREILPLMEDIEHPQGMGGHVPVERLRREVGEVFARRRASRRGLGELLAEIEKWVRRDPARAAREEGTALVRALQELLLGGAVLREEAASFEAAPRALRAAASFEVLSASPPSPSMLPAAPTAAGRTPRREVTKRREELIEGLDRVERRLTEALEHLRTSGIEAERVLEVIRRERRILEEMWAKESDRPGGASD
jgi:hypothetical protein